MRESRSIDLHNHTVPEALGEFARFYNDCVRSGYRGRIEVIHGYGSTGAGGAIRRELRRYLAAHVETFGQFLPGDSLGNPGITIIYPQKLLPSAPNGPSGAPLLNPAQEAIRRFCDEAKSRERILAKLRGRFGDRVLATEIRQMVNLGLLEATPSSDGVTRYRTV
ncbi:MAG: Smr/MutS family protein [Terracidiphilus sp.]